MALRNQEIGSRIRQLREERGAPPQTTVAEALGVSERAYQNWEAGTAKPSYRSLQRLAEYFGVGEDFILSGTESQVEPPNPFKLSDQINDMADEFRGYVKQLLERQDELAKGLAAVLEQLEAVRERQEQRKAA